MRRLLPDRGSLLRSLHKLDELRGAGARMHLDTPPLGPGIGVVMVSDPRDEQAVRGPVDHQAQIAARPRGPEIRVARSFDAVHRQALAGRVLLQVERRQLRRFLLLPGQAHECVGKGGGDADDHGR